MSATAHGDIVRFFAPDYEAWRSSRISAAGRSAWRSTATTTCSSASAAWASTGSRRERRSRSSPTRPTAAGSRSSTIPACGSPTISTSRPTDASSSARRRSATRCTNGRSTPGGARQRPHHLLRPEHRHDAHGVPRICIFPNGICMRQRRPVVPVRRDLGLPRPALLVRRAEGGHGRAGDRQPAGLSRQHQPRVGRQLLAGAGRHARAGASTWPCRCRASASAWRKRIAARRVAVSRTSTPAASSGSTRPAGCSRRCGTCGGAEPPDDHLDARAQGLPLHRRHPEQPHRPAASSRAPIRTGRGQRSYWGQSHDRRGLAGPATVCSAAATHAVTVPPLDGALRPNRLLDEAEVVADARRRRQTSLVDGDALLVAAAAARSVAWTEPAAHAPSRAFDSAVTCLAVAGGRARGRARRRRGRASTAARIDGRRYRRRRPARCAASTALARRPRTRSRRQRLGARNAADDWQRDLLERNASAASGASTSRAATTSCIARRPGLPPASWSADRRECSFPRAGGTGSLAAHPAGATPAIVLRRSARLSRPAIAGCDGGGYWLALFAPRSQLVEFVLREPAYRKRMMAEVRSRFWMRRRSASGRSFYEPLQGGGVKHLGLLKPWAPTVSATASCVRLDRRRSSRASACTAAPTAAPTASPPRSSIDGRLFVAARGDGVVVLAAAATESGRGERMTPIVEAAQRDQGVSRRRRRSRTSTSRFTAARCMRCSARTAPASRR